jgi:HPt (histidine-containing phosphotransfer) domain-containing protein
MNDFLVKPIDPQGLIARLNLWLVPASAPSSLDLESKDCQEQGMEIAANLQWPEITGIDAAQVAFILGGDQTLFAELLEIFVKENSVLICLAHDQVENASKIAHKLKGQAANLGATELANAAGLLENALNTGSNDIQDRQKSLFAANERIMHAICLWQKD